MSSKQLGSVTRVIAHVDHGKTTVMDSLIAFQGQISRSLAGDLRYMDSRPDEQTREITLKLGFIGMPDGNIFIDTPGHVDFDSFMLSSALISDNHLFIIDVNEGVTPRTFNHIRHLDFKKTILVLNKIDKCDNVDILQSVIHEINAYSTASKFSWESGNVVLSDAVFCCGINYLGFKFSNKNTLKGAFKAYKRLCEIYDKSVLEEDRDENITGIEQEVINARVGISNLMKKYNIKYKSRKSILGTIMPLGSAIYTSLKTISDKEGVNILRTVNTGELGTVKTSKSSTPNTVESGTVNTVGHDRVNTANTVNIDELNTLNTDKSNKQINNIKSINTRLCKIKLNNKKNNIPFVGIASCCIWKEPGILSEDNILFVCKIQQGIIRKGDVVYSKNRTEENRVEVKGVYKFIADVPVEVDSSENIPLVCLEGGFLKNCIISSEPVDFDMQSIPLPLFCSKLVLNSLEQLDGIKQAIRALSYVEQPLKAKKNKYSEIEIRCCGTVQFEKICTDLRNAGFDFFIGEPTLELREKVTVEKQSHYVSDNLEFILTIRPYEVDVSYMADEENKNPMKVVRNQMERRTFIIKNARSPHVVESILEMFTESGPLVMEKVVDIEITVEFIREEEAVTYGILKKELSDLYMSCEPVGTPKTVDLHIILEHKYTDTAYSVLRKYSYSLLESDDYDDTGFDCVHCRVPQFSLQPLEEDLRRKTRGTVCINAVESGFHEVKGFEGVVEKLRIEKGIVSQSKIVDNPEQQRTLKRK